MFLNYKLENFGLRLTDESGWDVGKLYKYHDGCWWVELTDQEPVGPFRDLDAAKYRALSDVIESRSA